MKSIVSISEAARRLSSDGNEVTTRTLHRALKRAKMKVLRVGTSFGITMDQARLAYEEHTIQGRKKKASS